MKIPVMASHGVAGRQPATSMDVQTMRSIGTTSRKTPGLSLSPPSGPLMKVWNAPPLRKSKARTSVFQGFGHHHCFRISGSCQARHTFARGAATRRTISRSSLPSLIVMSFHQCIEPIETRLPQGALS